MGNINVGGGNNFSFYKKSGSVAGKKSQKKFISIKKKFVENQTLTPVL